MTSDRRSRARWGAVLAAGGALAWGVSPGGASAQPPRRAAGEVTRSDGTQPAPAGPSAPPVFHGVDQAQAAAVDEGEAGADSTAVLLLAFCAGFQSLATLPAELVVPARGSERRPRSATPRPPPVDPPPRQRRPGDLIVASRYVDPPADARKRIDEDRLVLGRIFQQAAKELAVKRSFRWPCPRKVRARFGAHRRFNGKLNSVHLGIDLKGKIGDPVRAANDGKVVLSRELFYSGNTIYLDHGGGIFTGYYHLSQLGAEEGEQVKRGAIVGRVGETGRATGPHLHFAVRAGGRFVDPEWFIRQPLARTRAAITGSLARGRSEKARRKR